MGLVTKRLRRPIGTAEMMASPQEHIDSETAAGALREDYAPSWADGGSYTLNCAIKSSSGSAPRPLRNFNSAVDDRHGLSERSRAEVGKHPLERRLFVLYRDAMQHRQKSQRPSGSSGLQGQVFTLAVKRHSICFSNHQR